jgi:hypothetical protein
VVGPGDDCKGVDALDVAVVVLHCVEEGLFGADEGVVGDVIGYGAHIAPLHLSLLLYGYLEALQQTVRLFSFRRRFE